jgi:hypothetical protein
MCGHYASHLPPDAKSRLFRTAGPVPNLAPKTFAKSVETVLNPARSKFGWP